MIIGLTGGMGSGKSVVANIFAKLGIDVFYADKIGREVLETDDDVVAQISKRYDNEITIAGAARSQDDLKTNDQEYPQRRIIDKVKLRNIIFSKSREKLWLENLLHPLIRQKISALIGNSASSYCILESAILVESKFHEKTDKIIVVDCSEEQQLARVMERNQYSENEVKVIMRSQLSRSDRLKHADFVINNNESSGHLKAQVIRLHNQILGIKPTK